MRNFYRSMFTHLAVPLWAWTTPLFGMQDPESAQKDTAGPAYNFPTVIVVGSAERLMKIAGSAAILFKKELIGSRVFNTNELLRKLPGVHIREEDAFAMRPNIGLRGLNPTRSTKILLLEDGIPLTYAPYGDNASYYHPPVERFDRTEVLKGSEQVVFGPQTAGGVINYITPAPLREFGGMVRLAGGNRDYWKGHVRLGGDGLLLDAMHKQANGSRDNERYRTNDVNLKSAFTWGASEALTLRANYYGERSFLTYTGITQAELSNFGIRYNPFRNDELDVNRYGVSATYARELNAAAVLTTSVYVSRFERDWWRQSSSTGDLQGGAAVRAARIAGERIDPDTIGSIQGRLRNYWTYGIEPRLSVRHHVFGIEGELNAGVRVHYELQKRQQVNSTSHKVRSGTTVEDNDRSTDAYSGFVQHRFRVGEWTFTPGVRVEHVVGRRADHLSGANGTSGLTEVIPAFGLTFTPVEATTFFAGVHRGFAPPRTEDLILTTSGQPVATFTDVESERSWNYELGVRSTAFSGLNMDATLFRNDFENLIAVGSIAGGSTPLAQAEAEFQGLEFSTRANSQELFQTIGDFSLQIAYTFLATAEQKTPFIRVADKQPVAGSKAGNRMPYAPKHTVTTGLGYTHLSGWDLQLEIVYVGEQFSDFTNLETPAPDGQAGLIQEYTIFNATLNYPFHEWGLTVFIAAKNLANREYIADRTRGIRPGAPRVLQIGIEYQR